MGQDGLRAERRHQLGGAGHADVAGEDGGGVAPDDLSARGAAAQRSLIHDVVVVEGGDVGQLHDDGSTNQIRIVDLVTELGAQHHQQWTESLAAGGNDVVGRLGDERRVGAGLATQLILDEGKFGGHQIGELAAGAVRHSSPLPTGRVLGARPAVVSP